ncbi:arylsulfatase [Actinomadura flavalba]|uniref:arylsulfatase n=1 Tax=Actinomadura flavalba TaxID=1120938 RepID=UPI00035C1AED|nr:arylsulfatase [Actinomadura flavalba]
MPSSERPNVMVILCDDLGFSDIGCFGGEIPTPAVDGLAERGVRMTQFYNTARCSPSRASLLTGLHPHQTGIGILTADDRPAGYAGTLSEDCVTIAEVLRDAGYGTYMAGKWHVSGHTGRIDETWPLGRGFERFFGTCNGGGSYYWPATLAEDDAFLSYDDRPDDFYFTDAITARTQRYVREHVRDRPHDPFFCYVAYTAPHWPLHAPEELVAAQAGRYDEGWDVVRERRRERQREGGWFGTSFEAAPRDPEVPPWDEAPDREWQARCMEVYAAQVARMDEGIGHILETLRETGTEENTLVLFLSDNGGSAEVIPVGRNRLPFPRRTPDGRPIEIGNTPQTRPGAEETFVSYGKAWANVSNTPFREYKHWVHEGGIATPLVARWPARLPPGRLVHDAHQLPDIMATVLEVTGAHYPLTRAGTPVQAPEGASMLGGWTGQAAAAGRYLFWEHEGNAACRRDDWKLVKRYPGAWELYDLRTDRAELRDLALERREIVRELADAYQAWSVRVGVIPPEVWRPLYERE